MRSPWRGFRSSLADPIKRYLAHKRAIGRHYDADEKNLRLFDRFMVRRRVTDIDAITPDVVDAFLVSRARRATGHNHLLGTVRRFFAWLVLQFPPSVSRCRRRGSWSATRSTTCSADFPSRAAAGTLPDVGGFAIQLVADAGLAVVVLAVITTLGIYKPWGRTRYGRRKELDEQSTERETTAGGLPLGLKIFLAVIGLIVVAFVVLHLSGRGLGGHSR